MAMRSAPPMPATRRSPNRKNNIMPSANQQQECPRRAGASPQTGEPQQRDSRAAKQTQHRVLDFDMPRMLSAGTVALAVASAAVLMLAGCADMGHQTAPVAQRTAVAMGLAADQQTTAVDA